MAFDPKPVVLTQVDAEDYAGFGAPQPLVVVGDVPVPDGTVLVPAPPSSGDFTLTSEDGVLSWVEVTP